MCWIVLYTFPRKREVVLYKMIGGKIMDFWLLDVKSLINVNGNDVCFDYINTYFDSNEAIKEAKLLSEDEDVLEVSVHHWILKDDGIQEHAENGDKTDIPYYFLNKNHRELKEGV